MLNKHKIYEVSHLRVPSLGTWNAGIYPPLDTHGCQTTTVMILLRLVTLDAHGCQLLMAAMVAHNVRTHVLLHGNQYSHRSGPSLLVREHMVGVDEAADGIE